MRINEHNSLDELLMNTKVQEILGSSDGKRRYMGIEFSYKGVLLMNV